MKYDLFIKTLERGRDEGLGRKFNISDILKIEFTKPTTTDINKWNAECAIQFDVLKDMKNELKIIKFQESEFNKIHWIFGNSKSTWFDEVEFYVWVTVAGLDYLNQYYLRQSSFRLNSILETNTELQTGFDRVVASNSDIQATASRRQTRIFRWTAVFACGAMVITGLSLMRDIHKDNLSQQVKEKDSLIQQLQKKINLLKTDSSGVKMAKKTSPKRVF
jgi:hypothetical protein